MKPNVCFVFKEMDENCFFLLEQNYNCVLGLKNITGNSEFARIRIFSSVMLSIPDKCWWMMKRADISNQWNTGKMICDSQLKLQSRLWCERNVGGLSVQHMLEGDSQGTIFDATEDRKWWHFSPLGKWIC